jgi:putative exporter of polyketide antibiotics
MAVATLGRVWVLALAILLVGLADRESGLAAAVLAIVLFTVHLTGTALSRLLTPEQDG